MSSTGGTSTTGGDAYTPSQRLAPGAASLPAQPSTPLARTAGTTGNATARTAGIAGNDADDRVSDASGRVPNEEKPANGTDATGGGRIDRTGTGTAAVSRDGSLIDDQGTNNSIYASGQGTVVRTDNEPGAAGHAVNNHITANGEAVSVRANNLRNSVINNQLGGQSNRDNTYRLRNSGSVTVETGGTNSDGTAIDAHDNYYSVDAANGTHIQNKGARNQFTVEDGQNNQIKADRNTVDANIAVNGGSENLVTLKEGSEGAEVSIEPGSDKLKVSVGGRDNTIYTDGGSDGTNISVINDQKDKGNNTVDIKNGANLDIALQNATDARVTVDGNRVTVVDANDPGKTLGSGEFANGNLHLDNINGGTLSISSHPAQTDPPTAGQPAEQQPALPPDTRDPNRLDGKSWAEARRTLQGENQQMGGPGTVDGDIARSIQRDAKSYTIQNGTALEDIAQGIYRANNQDKLNAQESELDANAVARIQADIIARNKDTIRDPNKINAGTSLNLDGIATPQQAAAPVPASTPASESVMPTSSNQELGIVVIDNFNPAQDQEDASNNNSNHGKTVADRLQFGGADPSLAGRIRLTRRNVGEPDGMRLNNAQIGTVLQETIDQARRDRNSVRAVNLSVQDFTGNEANESVRDSISTLRAMGIPVVVAAGNQDDENVNKVNKLAGPDAIIVQSGTSDGKVNPDSQPTDNPRNTIVAQGPTTSVATPAVTALAAELQAQGMSVDEIVRRLQAIARENGGTIPEAPGNIQFGTDPDAR